MEISHINDITKAYWLHNIIKLLQPFTVFLQSPLSSIQSNVPRLTLTLTHGAQHRWRSQLWS